MPDASQFTQIKRLQTSAAADQGAGPNKFRAPRFYDGWNPGQLIKYGANALTSNKFLQRPSTKYYIYTLPIPGYPTLISAGLFIDGHTIYATAGDSVVKYDMISGNTSILLVQSGSVINAFLNVVGDYLYIGTVNENVMRVNKNTFTSATLEVYQTISGSQSRTVTSDSAGNIYVITQGGRLFKNGDSTQLNAGNNFGTNTNGATCHIEGGVEYLYVCQTGLHKVIKVDLGYPDDPSKTTVFAGNGFSNILGENVIATAGGTANPRFITFDSSGNAYISTSGSGTASIRKVDTSGRISTFAGTGVVGYSGDGGPASDATFNQPAQSQFDSNGNMYIKDNINNVIRLIRPITFF